MLPSVLNNTFRRRLGELCMLQWHITSRCAGNCKFCYVLDSPNYEKELSEELPVEQCLELIEDFSVYLKKNRLFGAVLLTGGDPMLKNGFDSILEALRKEDIAVSVLGNPHLIDNRTAEELREKKLWNYQLSIDGSEDTHDYFRGKGSFQKTWEAVDVLRQHRIPVGISYTLSALNYWEVENIIELCVQHGVNIFRPTRLVPEGRGKDYRKYSLTPTQYQEILSRIYIKISYFYNQGFMVFLPTCDSLGEVCILDGSCGLPELISSVVEVGKGCHGKFLDITPDGTVYPCRRLPIKIGNIMEDSFEKLFSAPLIKRISSQNSFEECGSCQYLKTCRGGCPAVTYAVKGDPFKKDPQCWVN